MKEIQAVQFVEEFLEEEKQFFTAVFEETFLIFIKTEDDDVRVISLNLN